MKQLFFAILAGLTLASCSEISTDPTPARTTRTAQTVTVTYNLTNSTIVGDTLLQGAQIDVYTLTPVANADGTLTYPAITSSTTPVFTTTAITNSAQTFTVPVSNVTVLDNTPNLGIRVVLRSTNRPGRRANSQRLTSSVFINGTSRVTFNHQGTNFSRTAAVPSVGYFSTTGDTNLAGYTY